MEIIDLDIEGHLAISTQTLRWRHNGCDSVSNHQPRECLLRRLIRRTSKKTSKLRVTGLCAGNSPETGEFPAQMASNAKNVSIWWRHHDSRKFGLLAWWLITDFGWNHQICTKHTSWDTLSVCWKWRSRPWPSRLFWPFWLRIFGNSACQSDNL